MSSSYFSKAITMSSTGMTISVWSIDGWRLRTNVDPTKITYTVSVSGYASTDALSSGLSPVPGNKYIYRLTQTNFPTGTDLTAVNLADIYAAVLAYITNTASDPLNGATLISI